MTNIKRLMEMAGVTPSAELLVEYANGGQLDKVLVVCNPTSTAQSYEDCIKEVTAKELFLLATSAEDIETMNPIIYYTRATGAAKKDAKSRFEALEDAHAKRSEADELEKAAKEAVTTADDAEKLAGITKSNDVDAITPEEDASQDYEPHDPDAEQDENEEVTDVTNIEDIKESAEVVDGYAPTSDGNGITSPKLDGDNAHKVQVPEEILKDIKNCIKDNKAKAEHFHKMERYSDEAMFYEKIVDCATEILELLEQSNQTDFDKAALTFSSYMGPIQLQLPTSLSKYLKFGGRPGRSLRDYFLDAKKG